MPKTKRIKTIEAGQLREIVIYTPPTRYDTQQQRAQRSKATTRAQAAMNLKNRRKRLEFIIAGNFGPQDRFITLTYDDEHLPATRKEARANVPRYLAQLRELRRRFGLQFKYVYGTEGIHGESRLHHHIIITAAPGDLEQLQSLWPYGNVDIETLGKYGSDRCAILAAYILKERKPNGEQGYTNSKNIDPPRITAEWIDEDCALTAPRGAVILEEGKEIQPFSEYYHLKYLRPDNAGRKEKIDNGATAPMGLVTHNNFRKEDREKRAGPLSKNLSCSSIKA